jgi:hypothetical protein
LNRISIYNASKWDGADENFNDDSKKRTKSRVRKSGVSGESAVSNRSSA